MKKIIFSFILGLILFTNPALAKTESTSFSQYFNVFDYNYFFEKDKFKQINDYSDASLEKVVKPGGIIVFYSEVKNSDNSIIRSGEWFKLINGKQVNYKETIETGYRTTNQLYIADISANEYYVDTTKCQSGLEFINNNCQSKNRKSLEYSYFMGKRAKANIFLEYPNSVGSRDDAYTKFTVKQDYADKLETIYSIKVKRDKNNKILNASMYEYDNKKVVNSIHTIKMDIRNDLYDVNNIRSFGLRFKDYDNKGRIIRDSIEYETDENYVPTYLKQIEYHRNNKIYLMSVQKRNLNNKLVYDQINKYNNRGVKRGSIRYFFKNGTKVQRKEYIFNTKGKLRAKAFRYTSSFKKGKIAKTYRQSYNNKGKLSKRKAVKHRIDYKVAVEEEEWFFF